MSCDVPVVVSYDDEPSSAAMSQKGEGGSGRDSVREKMICGFMLIYNNERVFYKVVTQ